MFLSIDFPQSFPGYTSRKKPPPLFFEQPITLQKLDLPIGLACRPRSLNVDLNAFKYIANFKYNPARLKVTILERVAPLYILSYLLPVHYPSTMADLTMSSGFTIYNSDNPEQAEEAFGRLGVIVDDVMKSRDVMNIHVVEHSILNGIEYCTFWFRGVVEMTRHQLLLHQSSWRSPGAQPLRQPPCLVCLKMAPVSFYEASSGSAFPLLELITSLFFYLAR
jgi:hypothetical protein